MKRALVTGGSGAIGAVICRELAGNGHHVIVHAHRNLDRASAIVDEIRNTGGSAETVSFDLCDANATQQSVKELLDNGPVQILVNNAGICDDAPLAGMTQSQWQKVLDMSLNGFFNVTQPLLLPMIRTRWGRIINITSIAAIIGNRGQVNYAAAKAGLHGATKALALELAARGITVNAIAPGIIESPMTEGIFTPEQIAVLVPMKRAGTPLDVAHLVNFLASEQSAYISGQIIQVNGAMA